MTGRPQIQRRVQTHTPQFHFNSLSTQSSSCRRVVKSTLSRSLLPKFPVKTFLTTRVHIHHDTWRLKTSLVTQPLFQAEPRRGPHSHLAPVVLNNLLTPSDGINWNDTAVYVLGFCVGFVVAQSFWAWFFCFSVRAFGNGVCSLLLLIEVVNLETGNSLKWPRYKKSKRWDNKRCIVKVRWVTFIENLTVCLYY